MSGKTIAEKIFTKKSSKNAKAGDVVVAELDFIMGHDGTTPLALKVLEDMNVSKPISSDKMAFIIDHNSPSPNEGTSNLHQRIRNFTIDNNIKLYDIGQGICHQLLPERGHVVPGDLVVGADSHTCTYGALNVFSTGVGSTDLAAAIASGKLWFKVPKTIKLKMQGELPSGVFSKDVILYVIGDMTADGATYKSVEFTGSLIENLSVQARFTISNMAVEMGAKAGLMETDEKVMEWVRNHSYRSYNKVFADNDAEYEKVIEYDFSDLVPQVAKPHSVDNVVSINKVEGTPIQQAFLGTCTNGRYEDLKIAAEMLRNRNISQNVRFIVAPASKDIFMRAMNDGIFETIINAGGTIVTPGCGPCVGTHNGVPADGDNIISTANRNFKGRMGNNKADIYLGSPATVVASAVEGRIADPRKHIKEGDNFEIKG